MLACLLDALEQLRTLGTAYGVRWQREARLRGATTAAQYARPLADRAGDGPWTSSWPPAPGECSARSRTRWRTWTPQRSRLPTTRTWTDADEALTGSVHDSLLHVFRDAERRQRFAALRADNYRLGRVARAVAAEAVQLDAVAQHEAAIDRLVDVDRRLPSRRLAALRPAPRRRRREGGRRRLPSTARWPTSRASTWRRCSRRRPLARRRSPASRRSRRRSTATGRSRRGSWPTPRARPPTPSCSTPTPRWRSTSRR